MGLTSVPRLQHQHSLVLLWRGAGELFINLWPVGNADGHDQNPEQLQPEEQPLHEAAVTVDAKVDPSQREEGQHRQGRDPD